MSELRKTMAATFLATSGLISMNLHAGEPASAQPMKFDSPESQAYYEQFAGSFADRIGKFVLTSWTDVLKNRAITSKGMGTDGMSLTMMDRFQFQDLPGKTVCMDFHLVTHQKRGSMELNARVCNAPGEQPAFHFTPKGP